MNLKIFILFLYTSLVYAKYENNSARERRIPLLDTLLVALEDDIWEENEKPCMQSMKNILFSVKNNTLWAMWVWDSWQQPNTVLYGTQHQLGGFDQCLKPPWSGTHPHLASQYCTVKINFIASVDEKLTSYDPFMNLEDYVKKSNHLYRHFNSYIWGACVPKMCTVRDVIKISRIVHESTHLAGSDATLEVLSCKESSEDGFSFGFYIFMLLIITLSTLVLLSTFYVAHSKSDGVVKNLARCLCIRRNLASLTKEHEDDLRVLHAVKFLSSIFVIYFHYICFTIKMIGPNSLEFDEFVRSTLGNTMVHLDMSIDIFLIMSGILHTISILTQEEKGTYNAIRNLLQRYFRLVGIQAMMVFYLASVARHAGTGPLWDTLTAEEEESCRSSWWISLLMLNNYISPDKLCVIVSWYNACDYQLAILGTIVYCIYRRNAKLGIRVIAFVVISSITISAFTVYLYKLPVSLFYDIESMNKVRQNKVFVNIYVHAHNRTIPYLAGMALGYLTFTYKPSKYRNSINQKWSIVQLIILTIVIDFILRHSAYLLTVEYEVLEVTLFSILAKILYSGMICLFIGFCEYGTIPLLSGIMAFKPLVPLSRLTFGVYMVHIAIIYRIAHSFRGPFGFDVFTMLLMTLGIAVFSFVISFLLYFLVEAPLGNISSYLLNKRFNEKKQK